MITNLDKSRVARPLNIYVCSQCNKVFKKKTTLDEHVIKKHEIFERKDCYYKTTDEINLKKHNLIHSGANSELFSCHYCNAKLKRRQILDNHIVRKHPDFLESVKRKIHECSQCMYKTVFKPSFKRHLLMHGDIGCSSKRQDVDMASNIEPFVCYNCNYSAHSKGDLILHISVGACYSNMYSKESRFANTGQQPSKTYSCLQCSVVFKKKTALDEHCIKKHTDSITSVSSKIHECTYCNYKTTKKTNMTRHMVKHPSAVPKLSKCKYCNASFINGEILDNHVLKKHPAFEASIEREIFECLYCPYKTIVKRYYNEHMKVHFRGEQQSICEHCNAAFKSKRLLDAHIVKQHPKFIASVTSKIHKCSYCTYKTIHNGHFDAHLLIHSKGKTPTCEHCASTFKRKQLLNNHILKKHSDVFGSVSSKVSCQQCHVKFEGRQSLNKHMMETHPDHAASVKITPCKHCTMTFNSKYDLDDHIVRKHQEFIGSVTRKVFECSYCSYKTVRTNKSEKHILSHRRKVGLNQTPIKEEQTTDST
nr:unnamed protein product [Callosobruchus chinensis]